MPIKITKDTILQKIKEVHGDTYDLSKVDYVSMKTPITLICSKHGEFPVLPNSLIYQKSGCSFCGRERSEKAKYKPFDKVIEKCKDVHGETYDYSLITEYKDTTTKYPIICKTHGTFYQNFGHHMSGRGCKECGKESMINKRSLTQEEFLEKAFISQSDRFDYSKFNYKNYHTKSTVICKIHGEFEVSPINHLKGTNCPKCAKTVSRQESEVRDFLMGAISCEFSRRNLLGDSSEIDIFIPELNIGVEYNGLYFHSDKFQHRTYHLNKTIKANKNGIRLVHIFEDEWTYKKDIVKSRLLNIIGKTDIKLYARKCEVREVDSKTTSKFLKYNHIQGTVGATVRLGLYYNNELVSLMTFGGLRKNLGQTFKEGSFELLRFCNKLNTTVIGGASKLLKYFELNYKPLEIISYADRRWSEGELYLNLDFKEVDRTTPNYFYTKGNIRESRFSNRKDVLISKGHDKSKTEKQIMEDIGYARIYDCGTIKYKKVIH